MVTEVVSEWWNREVGYFQKTEVLPLNDSLFPLSFWMLPTVETLTIICCFLEKQHIYSFYLTTNSVEMSKTSKQLSNLSLGWDSDWKVKQTVDREQHAQVKRVFFSTDAVHFSSLCKSWSVTQKRTLCRFMEILQAAESAGSSRKNQGNVENQNVLLGNELWCDNESNLRLNVRL